MYVVNVQRVNFRILFHVDATYVHPDPGICLYSKLDVCGEWKDTY